MRHMMLLVSGLLATGVLAGCSGDNNNQMPTSPSTPSTPTPPAGGGTGSGSSGGSTGGGTGITPSTAAVNVGDIFFKSARNGTSNTAVDTVAVNGTVTWTWASGETLPHSVQSLGSPSFTSSTIQSGAGSTYQFKFTSPGTYHYNCGVHGNLMTGTIVVMAAAASSSAPTPAPTPTPPPPTYP